MPAPLPIGLNRYIWRLAVEKHCGVPLPTPNWSPPPLVGGLFVVQGRLLLLCQRRGWMSQGRYNRVDRSIWTTETMIYFIAGNKLHDGFVEHRHHQAAKNKITLINTRRVAFRSFILRSQQSSSNHLDFP
eukprot:sb/3475143/